MKQSNYTFDSLSEAVPVIYDVVITHTITLVARFFYGMERIKASNDIIGIAHIVSKATGTKAADISCSSLRTASPQCDLDTSVDSLPGERVLQPSYMVQKLRFADCADLLKKNHRFFC